MEPSELLTRAPKPWLRIGIMALVVAIGGTLFALGRTSDEGPRKTSVANDNTSATSEPAQLSLGTDEEADVTSTTVGAVTQTTTSAAQRATTSTTEPKAWDIVKYPDDPAGPTTTVKPDPLIVEFATTKGGNPWQIAAGFNNDLWFTESNSDVVGRITTDGKVTEFHTPTPLSQPGPITRGPDGAMWFVEMNAPNVGRITKDGKITEFPVPGLQGQNWGIVTGPDNALWFTSFNDTALIGRMTTSGVVTTWPLGTCPAQIAVGGDGKLWVTECRGDTFHRVALDGTSTTVTAAGMPDGVKYQMAKGPDGAMWFSFKSMQSTGGSIGRLSANGTLKWCELPGLADKGGAPDFLTAGPDGNLWFTMWNLNKVVRMSTDCTMRTFDATRPAGIAVGPDGNIWFTQQYDTVGRIDLSQL